MRKERIRERGQADNRYANIERERCRVLLSVMPDQLDPCVIGKNADFSLIMFLTLPKTCRYMRIGDIIGRYKRNY